VISDGNESDLAVDIATTTRGGGGRHAPATPLRGATDGSNQACEVSQFISGILLGDHYSYTP
jgi:hypothetical protein